MLNLNSVFFINTQAMRAAHEEDKFSTQGECFEMLGNYINLRLRMMAGKIRDLVNGNSNWEILAKKATSKQKEVFLKLCRCIAPTFMYEGSSAAAASSEEQSPLENHVEMRFASKNTSPNMYCETSLQLVEKAEDGQSLSVSWTS